MLNYLVLALAGTSMVAAAPANMTESYAVKMGIIRSNTHDMKNATNVVARQVAGLNTTAIGEEATGTLGGATGSLTDDFTGPVGGLGGDLTGEVGGAAVPGIDLSGLLDALLAPGVGGLGRMHRAEKMSAEEAQAMKEVEQTLTGLRDELRAMGM